MSNLYGIPTKAVTPGAPEWLTTISASKVPAILNVSPYDSANSLYNRIKGISPADTGTTNTRRGNYLEDGVRQWFADQHPEYTITDGGSWAHPDHPDWTCTPDGLATEGTTTIGIEIKTQARMDAWGDPGTSEIPVYYLVQTAWQMIITGIKEIRVPVLGPFLEFSEYVVTWADIAEDVPVIIDCVQEFQHMLATDTPPPVDGHPRTYEALRERHPDIERGAEVALPDHLAYGLLRAKATKDDAEAIEAEFKNLIAAELGDAHKATWNGATIYTRQARAGGIPYLVIGKNLPTINEQAPERKTA